MKPDSLTPIFDGEIKTGKLVLDEFEMFQAYLRTFEGKRVQVFLKELSLIRSDRAHGLYRIWLRLIGTKVGYSSGALHDLMMHRAGFHTQVDWAGKVDWIRWTQKNLSKLQFMELMEEAKEVAAFSEVPLVYKGRFVL